MQPRSGQSRNEGPALGITLPDRLTIAEAGALQRELTDAAAQDVAIHIDGSQVAEIDTACLQVLLCLWRARAGGPPCEWRGVSAALRRSAELIGLDGLLRLPDGDAPGRRADAGN